MEIGESRVNKIIYNTHRKIFSGLVRFITGGVPIAVNIQAPRYALEKNRPRIREIFSTLANTNLTVYPYGNWFESGEQTFHEEDDLQDGANFVNVNDFEKWRNSLKIGFIKIAQKSKAPIVPVYVENNNGEWCVIFGKPITPSDGIPDIDLAKTYLTCMRELKAQSTSASFHRAEKA